MAIINKMVFQEGESSHIISLQGLRGLAILGIFLFHAGYGPFGTLGVSIFIVLSGFVMAYTYLDRELPATMFRSIEFSLIKVKKLFFANLFALVIYLPLIVHSMANDSTKMNLLKVMLDICMLKSFVPSETYFGFGNRPNWYLSICLVTYFLFPLILKLLKKARHLNLLAVTLLLVDILFAIFLEVFAFSSSFCWWATYICPLSRIPEFVIGCIMGKMYKDKNCEKRKKNSGGGVLLNTGTSYYRNRNRRNVQLCIREHYFVW